MSAPIMPALIGSLLSWPIRKAAEIGLAMTSGWIVAGAQDILAEVIKVISLVSTPSLTASWFSPSYWRIASLALLLTVPFLFAAAIQAIVRADIGVLLRAGLIDLPIAVLAVSVTAPLIGLLLAATDEMCALVTHGGTPGGSFLTATAANLSTLHSGFMLVVIAVVIVLAGMAVMVELIMRAAAIYIVVLFLPLGFAAMVWPARRVWVKRMVETLIALILSKFAMVAILSLAVSGLASLGAGSGSLTTAFTAMALMVLAAFSPWALLTLLPFTEVAAGAGAMLHREAQNGSERGAKLAVNTAALASDPATAGQNALRHLVREGTVAQGALAGGAGLSLIPTRKRSASRDGGPGATEATPAGRSLETAPDRSVPVGAGDEAPRGRMQDAGGPGDAPQHPPSFDPGPPGMSSGSSGDAAGGRAGSSPASPVGAGSGSGSGSGSGQDGYSDVGTDTATVKGPVADLAPIWHPDYDRHKVNLRGDSLGGLVPPEDESPGQRVGPRPPAPEDDPGGFGL